LVARQRKRGEVFEVGETAGQIGVGKGLAEDGETADEEQRQSKLEAKSPNDE
jgi:hypothetical protein